MDATQLVGERKESVMADKELACIECGQPFTFSAGEQQFFADKGFVTPKRCHDCRAKRKKARQEGIVEDKNRSYRKWENRNMGGVVNMGDRKEEEENDEMPQKC